MVARRRYQAGCLFKRGKRRKVWVARWREDVLLEGGQLGRLHKSVVLGTVAELPTKRHALTKLDERIRPVNQGTSRPEASMSFGVFAESQWSALVLPTLKLSTQHGYKNVLNKHVLPYWRDWRLRDIGKLDVQQFVADKFPAVDHAWDVIHTIIRPIAGALVAWAAVSDRIPHGAVIVAAVIAGGAALGSHATKATVRGASTLATGGLANPVLSVIEDVFAFLNAVIAIFLPWLVILTMIVFSMFFYVLYRRVRRTRQVRA